MLELLGDKWSLMIIRDMIFDNRRHFRELLQNSTEGIASNILADRLKLMLEQGIITRARDPSHKQKVIYSLTERGIELLPVLVQIGDWGRKYLPVTKQHDMAARLLVEGGPGMLGFELLGKLWHEFRAEGVGAFEDELLGERFRSYESERERRQKMSEFHYDWIGAVGFGTKTSHSGRPERSDIS